MGAAQRGATAEDQAQRRGIDRGNRRSRLDDVKVLSMTAEFGSPKCAWAERSAVSSYSIRYRSSARVLRP